MSSTSASGKRSRTAASSSAAVSTVDGRDPGGRRERDVRGDEGHLRAAPRRLLGERQAHPARRAVADEAHRVDRLARAAGRDQHAQPVERARRVRRRLERRLDRGQDLRRLGQPPHPPLALRREPPGARGRRSGRRASAAAPGSPGWPGARTCGCSSPGASTSGAVLASAALVSRLSASPSASFASVFAEAGATHEHVAARRPARGARSGRGRAPGRPGTRRARGRARTRRPARARRSRPRRWPGPRTAGSPASAPPARSGPRRWRAAPARPPCRRRSRRLRRARIAGQRAPPSGSGT